MVEDLEAQGLMEKIEHYTLSASACERCGTVVEPLLSEQWFCRMKELAAPAIEVVKNGRVKFSPGQWNGVYLDWMENIRRLVHLPPALVGPPDSGLVSRRRD